MRKLWENIKLTASLIVLVVLGFIGMVGFIITGILTTFAAIGACVVVFFKNPK